VVASTNKEESLVKVSEKDWQVLELPFSRELYRKRRFFIEVQLQIPFV
jgi:hypothetical protein